MRSRDDIDTNESWHAACLDGVKLFGRQLSFTTSYMYTQSAMEFTRKRSLDDGGYDCNFADEPPSDLICQVCTCVARDPQQVSCCGKLYCNGCLKKHKAHSSSGRAFPTLGVIAR